MTPIEELIATADRLCTSMDQAMANEVNFCNSMSADLERLSWETLCVANDLKDLKRMGEGNDY